MKFEIPEDEVENILSVYWSMLREIESKATDDDVLNKMLVDDAYSLLNRCKISDVRPRWEKSNG